MQVNSVPNKLLYVSKHAIERYQQRIENCKPEEVIQRLRKIVEPHRKAKPGSWSIESRKCGPPCKVQFTINEDGSGGITSVYCVTDAQKTRALVDRNWQ
jgi:hypothetical protein